VRAARDSKMEIPLNSHKNSFYLGVFLICASTLMYEVVLTRLLSVLCWYYLAFVSISMAMFGMTAGALAVQLRPDWFDQQHISNRLAQAAFATGVSMPVTLIMLLSVPLDLAMAVQTFFSFLLFSSIIAVPFFFSGVAVCLALTRTPFPIGRIYFADLLGAGAGCVAAVLLLKLMDAPSGVFAISALLFLSAAAYATHADDRQYRSRSYTCAAAMLLIAGLNAQTIHGIQPIWSKGNIDRRQGVAAELWNPISRVRARDVRRERVPLWGPSPVTPTSLTVEDIPLDIDNDAGTAMLHFQGDLTPFQFLRYDVTSLGAELRAGGTAAIIGVGGGRDVLNCAVNGFQRIVGIEVNSAIVDFDTRRFAYFSGFDKIPGFELHNEEGRSYLTRTSEKFDMIQASLVDTWAATSAGAFALTENSLYTVDAWRVFYRHLKLGGLITFSRWYDGAEAVQTYRVFSLAWATLLAEGAADPSSHVALLSSGPVATILVSNRPFSEADLVKLRSIAGQLQFTIIYLPGDTPSVPELRAIMSSRTLDQLARVRTPHQLDDSPVFDSSPYFFNVVRLRNLPRMVGLGTQGGSLRALLFVFAFMLAASVLVIFTILLPLSRWARRRSGTPTPLAGGIFYFIAIGIGFMLVEMAMMQQLSIFLGHPVYSLVVVLAGLIISAGVGSLISDRLPLNSSASSRVPAFLVAILIALYSVSAVPIIHRYIAGMLWERAILSLAMVAPCGFLMGFCFPTGLRWMVLLGQKQNLPWMWALNGAAATLGSFLAIVISMETSITACMLTGAACYVLAGLTLPSSRVAVSNPELQSAAIT
jgi:hypothetical protein